MPGFTCLAELDEMAPLCLQLCDPLLQDCALGESCVSLESVDFVCVPSGGKGQGEGCGPLDCAPGLHCAAAEALPTCDHERCCTPYCDLTDPEGCADAGSTECVPFADGNEPPQFYDMGYCGVPE
jgi:hypothetical protein